MAQISIAQLPQNGWAGDDPQSRSGGCAFFTLTPNPTPPTCNDFEDGVASVIPSDGVGPFTYNWIGGPSTQTWNNVGAGTYTVIVFDQGQGGAPCNIDVFVNEPGPLTVFEMNAVPPTCFGACNGEASPIVIGGNGGYTFDWDSGESGFSATQLCDPFTMTITDSEGCVLDTVYNFIDGPEEIIITADSTNISCFGDTDGTIDITVTGGDPDYTYAWTGPNGFSSADEDISNLEAGSYTVTVTDQSGCEGEATFEITEPDELELSATITDNPCAGDTLGSIVLTPSGGTPTYSFAWTGPNGFSSSDQDIFSLESGNYDLVMTDANGCEFNDSFTIAEPPTIDIELTVTPISCNGETDGAIETVIAGGAGDFSVSWVGPDGFTANTENISTLAAGSYTITVTDSSGCSNEATAEINEPDLLLVDGNTEDVSCSGADDGAITLSVSGGTPDYNFSWTGPDGFSSSDQNLSDLAPGSYTVTLADESGCEQVVNFEITEPTLIELSADITDNLCAGQEVGAIDLTITGGTPPYTVSWSGPDGFSSSDEDISDLMQGSYSVEVTDTNGCVQSEVFEVSETNPIVLELTPTDLVCPDDTDGAIDLEISGGTPDFDILWTGPDGFSSSDEDITGLSQGVYVVEVTDINGCTATDATEILAPDTMVVQATISPVSCIGENDGAIEITVSGGAPDYTFSWTGPDGFTAATANISGLSPGTYNLTITDANDCTKELPYEIEDAEPIDLSGDITELTCDGVIDGAIDLTVSGGTPPYSFQWSGPGGFSSTQEDLSGLNVGNYTVQVTDSLGCTANESFAMTAAEGVIADGVVTDASCDSNDDGMIVATVSGGTPPYSIFWIGPNGFTGNTLTITGLEAGTYTFFATDSEDCFDEVSFTVNNPSGIELDAEITDLLCSGDTDGAIDITLTNAIEPITITWSGPDGYTSSDEDITDLAGGDYTITIIDSLGCQTEAVYTVNEPTAIDLSLLVTQPTCGLSNGQIIANVSGGTVADDYTYLWTDEFNNPIGANNQVNGLGTGTYTITVTDDNGCEVSETVELTETDIEVTADITDLQCNGDTDGAIDITVTGGAPPYVFEWSGPDGFTSADEDIFNLAGGSYILTVTDSLNCSKIENYTIAEPDTISIVSDSEDISCNGETDGSITVSVSGGTAPYTYSWQGPGGFTSTDSILTGLGTGTYTLELTDANGCEASTAVTIDEPALIEVTADITAILCSGQAEGAIGLTITGGTAPYTIDWSGPDGFASDLEDISNLLAGEYVLVITDANDCVFADSYTVIEENPIEIDADVSPITCIGENDGAISVSVTGGTPEYTYSWNGPDGFTADTPDISALTPGTYNVLVTDSNDCFSEIAVELQDASEIELSADITDLTCNGVLDGVIDLTVSGGTPPYSYQWSGPGGFTSTQEDLSGLNVGNYTVLVTDSLGCTANASYTVSANEGVIAEGVVTDASCDTNDDGMITATVSGGSPPYSIFWIGPNGFTGNTLTITGLEAGTYTFFATDSEDCFAEVNFTVNNPSDVEIDADITDLLCAGESTGAIDITLTGTTGPVTTVWSGPDGFSSNDEDIAGLAGGNYTLTVIDSLNCITEEIFTVNEPPFIDLSLLVTQPTCGLSNGQIIANVSGGTISDDYTYLWTDEFNNVIGSTNQVSGLGSGSYTITVSDDNGCTVSETVNLIETDLEVDAVITDLLCNGDVDGSIEIAITGGVPPYVVDWTGPDGFASNDENIFNLSGGSYTLNITDSLNCTLVETYNVIEPDSIEITLTPTNPLCNSDSNGTILTNIIGGTPGYDISWMGPDGFTSADLNLADLAAGTYTLSVIDTNGCVAGDAVTLVEPDSLLVSAVVEDVSCNGDTTGIISITVSGGTPDYVISWSGPDGFNSDQTSLINLAAGTYNLNIVDANFCTLDTSFVISEPDTLQLTAVVSDISCFGENDGAITVTPTGGVADYTFNWNGPGGFVSSETTIDSLAQGDYQLLLTDSLGCLINTTFTIDEPEELLLDTDITQPECLQSNGEITAIVSGGSTPYTYQWEDEDGVVLSNDPTLSNLAAGLYFIQVTDTNGCVVSDWIVLSDQGGEILADITNVSCFGGDDGAISTTVLNAIEPLDYAWSNPDGFSADTPDITNLTANVYNLIVTDSLGCIYVESFEVTQPDSLSLMVNVEGISCFGGDGAISVDVSGGTPPYDYSWTGPGGFVADTSAISGLSEGDYTLVLTDSLGCTEEITVNVSELDPLTLDFDVTDIACNGANDGSISAIVNGGAPDYSFIWIGPGGFTADTVSIDNLAPGFYEVQVTDNNGCVITDGVMVNEPEAIVLNTSVINSTCGNDNGSVSVGASGGTVIGDYTYTWLDTDSVVIANTAGVGNLGPGAYTVIVTDDNNCTATETVVISDDNGEISAIITQPSCSTGDDGAIEISVTGGTEPYTFSWTGPDGYVSTDQNIDSLFPGTYVVEVTDSAGCVFVEQFELEIPETVELTFEVNPITCNGDDDGSIAVTISGGTEPYIIDWQGPDGFTSNDTLIQDLIPGTYTITVTDSALCVTQESIEITEPQPIDADFEVFNNLCSDDTNGAITVTVSGGTAPYTFQWIGPNGFESSGQNLGGLQTGLYELLITDTVGCTAQFMTEVTSTPPIEVELAITSPSCYGDSTGSISATISGGTLPYDLSWIGPDGFNAATANIINLVAGEYQLAVVDSNGCAMVLDTVLMQPDSLFADVIISDISCFEAGDGEISANVSGGTAPYEFAWTGPNGLIDTLSTISDLSAGTYDLIYTDSLGCTGILSAEISEPEELDVSLQNVSDALCSTDNSGQIEVDVTGGTEPYTFIWSGPDGFASDSSNITNLFPGDYFLTVADTNGCFDTLSVVVDYTFEISADAGVDTALCENLQPYILNGIPTNADSTWWADADGNVLTSADTLEVLEFPGVYTFYYHVSNGLCSDVDSVMVTIYALPVVNAGSGQSIVEGEEVTLGGNPTSPTGTDFLWVPNENVSDSTLANPSARPEITTNYEVIVTDSNGCVNNDFVLITVFPDIDIPTGISPNGDGYNDAWIIEHIEQFPNNVVEIYSRWGDMLHRAEGYDNSEPWEGFHNGKLLPVGTYYYVIELNDEKFPEPYTGPLTIFR